MMGSGDKYLGDEGKLTKWHGSCFIRADSHFISPSSQTVREGEAF